MSFSARPARTGEDCARSIAIPNSASQRHPNRHRCRRSFCATAFRLVRFAPATQRPAGEWAAFAKLLKPHVTYPLQSWLQPIPYLRLREFFFVWTFWTRKDNKFFVWLQFSYRMPEPLRQVALPYWPVGMTWDKQNVWLFPRQFTKFQHTILV